MGNINNWTPITKETLEQHGFISSSKVPGMYSYNGIYLISSALSKWQLCDKEGNVGNEYIETMEDLCKSENLLKG